MTFVRLASLSVRTHGSSHLAACAGPVVALRPRLHDFGGSHRGHGGTSRDGMNKSAAHLAISAAFRQVDTRDLFGYNLRSFEGSDSNGLPQLWRVQPSGPAGMLALSRGVAQASEAQEETGRQCHGHATDVAHCRPRTGALDRDHMVAPRSLERWRGAHSLARSTRRRAGPIDAHR